MRRPGSHQLTPGAASCAGVNRLGVDFQKLVAGASTVDEVRGLWQRAIAEGALTDDLRAALRVRCEQLAAAQGAVSA